MKNIYLIFITLVTSSFNIFGQCNTNTTICTPGIAGPFSFQNASNNPSTCLDFINGANTPNYAYIILYITQGGALNLLINGNNAGPFTGSCLDVALFDITNATDPCASLSPLTEIGCNYVFPCEGCAEFGTNINGCAAQEPAPIVQTGDVIMILVEDYSDLQTSFTLQLGSGPGSAQTGPPDATITPLAPICNDAPTVQLNAANGGGTWSGTGVSSSGVFNPAVAGIGFHVITYTLGNPPCQSTSQTTIEVINCNECTFTNIAANISACNPATNSFGVTGSVSFTEPPTTGQLIITTCNGVQQTFSAPFTSPLNYNLSNIPANGQTCNVTATFSADTDCTISLGNFTAPTCACFFTFIETNISACDGLTNTFEITGSVEFDSPPSTGTLIISDCNGNDQVFNAPFTSPTNYALTGITAGGTIDCEVTAVFSADTDCSISSGLFDYPPACDCPADIGTFTNSVTGMTNLNVPYNLCFNDALSITANGDYTPASPSATGSITYDPGIWLLVYECPPTIDTPDDINDDPCLLGVASTNDGAWTIINDIGDGETFYFVPITMYSMVDEFYSSVNSLINCYDLGPVYAVTYLPEMLSNHTTNCQNGTVTATVSGGTPATNGSLFTAQNLVPASASFDNTTAANNGTIIVSGLNDGDNYSFDIIDQNGCFVTVSGVFEGLEQANITYPNPIVCSTASNQSPTITGNQLGTFSATPAGLNINTTTGVINVGNSTAGVYTISYQTPSPICGSTSTFDLTVLPEIIAAQTSNCQNGTVTATVSGGTPATNGSLFTAQNLVPASASFDNTTAANNETIVVSGLNDGDNYSFDIIDQNGCFVTVSGVFEGLEQANITYPNPIVCSAASNQSPTITGNQLGIFSATPAGLNINTTTGVINVGNSTAGVYTISYQTPSPICGSTSTFDLTVLPEIIAVQTSNCQNGTVTATVSGGTPITNGSLFTAQNLVPASASFDNTTAANNETIVVSGLSPGVNYSFDIIDQNGCFVTVSGVFEGLDPVELTYPFSQYCVGQGTASPTVTGVLGGTFSSSAGLALNPSTGLINLENSAPGTYTINYQTPDPICFSTDIYTLTINPILTNTINQSVCENELPVVISGLNFTQAGQQIVNLTSSNGCDSILTINLTVLPLPQPGFNGSNLTGCAPLTAIFQNTTLGQFNNCSWNFGTGVIANGCGSVIHTFNQAGCYDITLTLTTQQGCTASFTIEDMVCVTPAPIANFTPIPNVMTTANPTTELVNTSTNAQNYLWIFGDNSGSSAEFSPIHTYPDVGGQYTITLYAYNGNCVDTATHTVFVNSEAIFYVPNTFTPDNDKFNQTFQPVFTSGFDVFNYNLLIFNRWGEVLFESNNAEIGWDGTYGGNLCQDGTYIWQITFKELGKDKREVIRGHVNLLK